jgi:lipopolysaccharide transport system permease protein
MSVDPDFASGGIFLWRYPYHLLTKRQDKRHKPLELNGLWETTDLSHGATTLVLEVLKMDVPAIAADLPRPDSLEPAPPEVVQIRPGSGWRALNLVELWRYRELLWFLAVRDIKLRYKQTALGVAWAVLQPLCTTGVFSIFFGVLAKVPSDDLPYPLFALTALLPWQLFSYALTQSSNSLVAEQRVITKVYFPRLVVPLASVLSGLVDFVVTFVLVLGLMAWYWWKGQPVTLTWAVLAVPLFVLFALAAALAVGLWLSALNVLYRDVRYTIPFLTQLWLFATPVAYPSSLVPAEWRPLYGLNPMAGVVESFRWALLGSGIVDWPMLGVSAGVVFVMLVGGLFYFRRLERTFADVV